MRALWLEQSRLRLIDTPDPGRPDECLVRVSLAGICGTDLEMRQGYAEFTGIPGHEFVGVVERVSRPEHRHWLGQRVVGEINIGCGTCRRCLEGVQEHCERREVLGIRQRHGAFAEFLTLPLQNLHAVPDAVSDGAAVFTEPVAAGCRILEQVAMGPRNQVAVMGDGRMGLLIAQVLRTTGAVVMLYGKHAARLTLARRLGIDARLTPDTALPASTRHDIVVEATGRADGLVRALGCVRPRGTLVLKSTIHDASTMATWPIVVDEISIVGSRCGPFAPALEMLASGAVKTGPLIEGVFDLSQFDPAFAAADGGLKVLFALAR